MSESMDYSLFAGLYDTYVRTGLDIPFFLKETSRVTGEVLELMSGTGRVSLPLLESGIQLTCIDASPEMLQILQEKASRRGLAADIHLMDIRELDLDKKFDLIFIPFHAFAELLSPEDHEKALERIYRHLSNEGRFICTLHNPPVRLQRVDGQLRLWSTNPLDDQSGRLLVWGLENHDPQFAIVNGIQFFEVYDRQGLLKSKRLVEFRFRIIEKGEFETMAEDCGFQVEALYGDYSYSPYDEHTSSFMIWKLCKVSG